MIIIKIFIVLVFMALCTSGVILTVLLTIDVIHEIFEDSESPLIRRIWTALHWSKEQEQTHESK